MRNSNRHFWQMMKTCVINVQRFSVITWHDVAYIRDGPFSSHVMNTFSTHVSFGYVHSVGDNIMNDVIMTGKYFVCCELCEDSHRLLLNTKTGYRPGFVLRSGLYNGGIFFMTPYADEMNWMSFSTNRQRLQECASLNSLCLPVCPPAYPYLITRDPMKGFSRSVIQKYTNTFLLPSAGWKVVIFQKA
jgi:hypothetical protein